MTQSVLLPKATGHEDTSHTDAVLPRSQFDPPAVSIGLFVFNGESVLRATLDALLAQTFADFELIISDNASTDRTEAICRAYAAADSRIDYIRQPTNIGVVANMKFVLDRSRCEYFMWAASDDTYSREFIEVNHTFLERNPDYVASTCPSGFEGDDPATRRFVDFKLDGNVFERFTTFFRYCWVSHGIFYSLIRTKTLKSCGIVGQFFLAMDWAIDLFLASKGKIHRTRDGYTLFGIGGVSRNTDVYKATRVSWVEFLLPFYRLAGYCASLTSTFTIAQKLKLAWILLKLNVTANLSRLRSTFELLAGRGRKPQGH